ncbi:cell wall hydrolase [Variovorax sp. DAIF25]|uniref:cell wall hydrolase n=1 Tax=Variovorax sp. DAIF25 TaxID=3080983 RepID=UPI003D6B5121
MWPTVENSARGRPGEGGTLGAILRDRRLPHRLYALTAGHAVGADPGTTAGDVIAFADSSGQLQFAGGLVDWAPTFPPDATTGAVDAAIVLVAQEDLRDLAMQSALWPVGAAIARSGDALRLLTSDRGPVDGSAQNSVAVSVRVEAGGPAYTLSPVQAWYAPGGTQGGDSGGAVWNDQDQLVGIHGGIRLGDPAQPFFIPIDTILRYFNADLVVRDELSSALAPVRGRRPLASAVERAPVQPVPPVVASKPSPFDDAHAEILARTIWGEARGEKEPGMRAIAFVVRNRVQRRSYWGSDVARVCRYPSAFSCWNPGDPNLPLLQAVGANDPWFRSALTIATQMLADARAGVSAQDPTNGGTHYHASSLVPPPWWTEGHAICAHIGKHVFYNDVK